MSRDSFASIYVSSVCVGVDCSVRVCVVCVEKLQWIASSWAWIESACVSWTSHMTAVLDCWTSGLVSLCVHVHQGWGYCNDWKATYPLPWIRHILQWFYCKQVSCSTLSCRSARKCDKVSWPYVYVHVASTELSQSVSLPINHCIPAGLLPSSYFDAILHSCVQTLLRLMQENHQLYVCPKWTATFQRSYFSTYCAIFLDYGNYVCHVIGYSIIITSFPLGSQLHYITLVAIVVVRTLCKIHIMWWLPVGSSITDSNWQSRYCCTTCMYLHV